MLIKHYTTVPKQSYPKNPSNVMGGVKTTSFVVSLGGSGVSIGGVKILWGTIVSDQKRFESMKPV